MSAENDILELERMIDDARDLLRHAAELAVQASGYEAGRQCPDCGGKKFVDRTLSYPGGFLIAVCEACKGSGAVVPPSDGDPRLLRLADGLAVAEKVVEMAVTPDVAELFRATNEYADEVQDRKDGLSL